MRKKKAISSEIKGRVGHNIKICLWLWVFALLIANADAHALQAQAEDALAHVRLRPGRAQKAFSKHDKVLIPRLTLFLLLFSLLAGGSMWHAACGNVA